MDNKACKYSKSLLSLWNTTKSTSVYCFNNDVHVFTVYDVGCMCYLILISSNLKEGDNWFQHLRSKVYLRQHWSWSSKILYICFPQT